VHVSRTFQHSARPERTYYALSMVLSPTVGPTIPDARLLTPKEPCVVMGSSTCYDPVSMPCLNYCPSTWCHWAAHVVFALTNEPGVLPPAHRKSSYLSRSVSFGASPSSSHLTWMAVPAVRVAPGSGLVHLTDALANGASAATAMRGSSRRDIVRCERSERQSGLLEGAAVRGGGFGGLVSGQGLSAYRDVGSIDVGSEQRAWGGPLGVVLSTLSREGVEVWRRAQGRLSIHGPSLALGPMNQSSHVHSVATSPM
jgi:hypothetical protein